MQNPGQFSAQINSKATGRKAVTKVACIVPPGEAHLRRAIREYVSHHHEERNHQGLGNKLNAPGAEATATMGRVHRRQRIGGSLNHYYREAA